jgi:GR25 family glycosyltransferase involved in LPS biosynthesis
MDYSKFCYKLHTLSFNRVNTVNATKAVLDQHINSLTSKTVGIFNQTQLELFVAQNSEFGLNLRNQSRPLKYPEVGLWASNYLAIKEFIDSEYDYLILVEDDTKLEPDFFEKLNTYMQEMPSDMDCFLAYKPENIFYNAGYELLQNEEQYHTDSEIIWIAHQTWSTCCILLNKVGAQKILDYINAGISDPIDLFLFGNQQGQYDVSSNSRRLKVYSPAKNQPAMAKLEIYKTIIQDGAVIELDNL